MSETRERIPVPEGYHIRPVREYAYVKGNREFKGIKLWVYCNECKARRHLVNGEAVPIDPAVHRENCSCHHRASKPSKREDDILHAERNVILIRPVGSKVSKDDDEIFKFMLAQHMAEQKYKARIRLETEKKGCRLCPNFLDREMNYCGNCGYELLPNR